MNDHHDTALIAVIPTQKEREATAIYRGLGKCGDIGYPLYPDGERWRTWCTLPVGHGGRHAHTDDMAIRWSSGGGI